MHEFNRPIILASKCLGFDACRYNGQMVKYDFIEKLKIYADFVTICPEVEIGLSTPREAIRIVKEEEIRLIEPKNKVDYTENMRRFSYKFLEDFGEVDGFIFKSRSPSCGIKDVKIYNSTQNATLSNKGKGFFAEAAMQIFPDKAIEDEGRLKDFNIREHFLIKLFALGDFRRVKKLNCEKELLNFHKRNFLLFSMYNKKQNRMLDNILENMKDVGLEETKKNYERHLLLVFARAPRYSSKLKVLKMSLENMYDRISIKEAELINDSIEKYEKGQLPFIVPLYLIKCYFVRFEEDLFNQSIFEPFPHGLVEMRDSGKVVK